MRPLVLVQIEEVTRVYVDWSAFIVTKVANVHLVIRVMNTEIHVTTHLLVTSIESMKKLNHTYPQHVIVTRLNESIAAYPSLVLRVNSLDVMNSTIQIHHATMLMAGQDAKHARYATAMGIVTL